VNFPSSTPILYLQAPVRAKYERKEISMRRYKVPYNGNQYVLKKSTGEIHDLDNETSQCKIDEIKPDMFIIVEVMILRRFMRS